ncbi:MAG: hypothetical protein COB88_05505 [Flavobacteriales bacterium]|nr:MAG: hypothetical protein COB88_05505 [Flavobacteriales bacterium]
MQRLYYYQSQRLYYIGAIMTKAWVKYLTKNKLNGTFSCFQPSLQRKMEKTKTIVKVRRNVD